MTTATEPPMRCDACGIVLAEKDVVHCQECGSNRCGPCIVSLAARLYGMGAEQLTRMAPKGSTPAFWLQACDGGCANGEEICPTCWDRPNREPGASIPSDPAALLCATCKAARRRREASPSAATARAGAALPEPERPAPGPITPEAVTKAVAEERRRQEIETRYLQQQATKGRRRR
jgi:hypothetical protein